MEWYSYDPWAILYALSMDWEGVRVMFVEVCFLCVRVCVHLSVYFASAF